MALSKAALDEILATGSAIIENQLASAGDTGWTKLVTQDTYDMYGYVPYAVGGVGSADEWDLSSPEGRILTELKTYGIRYDGTKYQKNVPVQIDEFEINPALKGGKIAKALADSIALTQAKLAYGIFKNNATGFDGVALFGNHTIRNDEAGDPIVVSNSIDTGTGPYWYVTNGKAAVKATRGSFQMQAKGAGSDTAYDTDSYHFGYKFDQINKAALWTNAVRSNKALTADNLQEAIDRLAEFTNDKGDPLDNDPTVLAVPFSLGAAARKILKVQVGANGSTNIYADVLDLVVSKLL